MSLLAIDTSLAACSVALWHDNAVAAERFEPMARGHAEALVPMIDDLRAASGVDLGALDAIAVTLGPGTFTGVRVGLAAARGLALVGGCAVVGVSTLAAIAATAALGEGPQILVVQDAKRGEVYAELIGPDPRGPVLLGWADLAASFPERPLRLVGSGAADAAGRLGGPVAVAATATLPRAGAVAGLATERIRRDGLAPGPPPAPLYLRAPDAKLPS